MYLNNPIIIVIGKFVYIAKKGCNIDIFTNVELQMQLIKRIFILVNTARAYFW